MHTSNYDPKHKVSLKNLYKSSKYLLFFEDNKKLIISTALSVWAISLGYALFGYTPMYATQASVQIKDSAITSKLLSTDTYHTTSSSSSNPVLNTMGLLKSDTVRIALWENFIRNNPQEMKRLKLEDIEAWENYFGDGSRFVSYKSLPGTDITYIKFKWTDPKLAKTGMEELLLALKSASQGLNQSEHHERYLYLRDQLTEVRDSLASLRERIKSFKEQNQAYDINNEIENYTRDRIEAESTLRSVQAEAENYKARMNTYQNMLGMNTKNAVTATALGRNTSLVKLYDQYYLLAEEYSSLKSRYTDSHVKVRQVKSQMDQIEANIQKEIERSGMNVAEDLKNPSIISDEARSQAAREMLDAEAVATGLSVKAGTINTALGDMKKRMQDLPRIEAVLASMQEEELSLSETLKTLQQKTMEAKMRETQTLSNVFIIDKPRIPTQPLAPTRKHILLTGLLMGFVASFAVVSAKNKIREYQFKAYIRARQNASMTELSESEKLTLQQKQTNGPK